MRAFLRSIKLDQYCEKLIESGNDDLQEMSKLPEEELRQALQEDVEMKPGHVRKFVNELKESNKRQAQPAQG